MLWVLRPKAFRLQFSYTMVKQSSPRYPTSMVDQTINIVLYSRVFSTLHLGKLGSDAGQIHLHSYRIVGYGLDRVVPFSTGNIGVLVDCPNSGAVY